MLHSICQQIWKTQQSPQDWKRSVFIPIPKKGNAKECSNYHTIALISHTSKILLKILQARLQQYLNHELPDVQTGFRKAEEPKIKLPTSAGSLKKQESSRKTSISALLTMPKPLTVWITIKCGTELREALVPLIYSTREWASLGQDLVCLNDNCIVRLNWVSWHNEASQKQLLKHVCVCIYIHTHTYIHTNITSQYHVCVYIAQILRLSSFHHSPVFFFFKIFGIRTILCRLSTLNYIFLSYILLFFFDYISFWHVGNSTAATGMEMVRIHSNPKEEPCQRVFKLPHKCIHFTS